MAYIGNTATTQAFTPAIDYFNGDGSTVAFTLSRPVASVAQVQAVISNVPQNPGSAFTVSNNTITFTSAPPSGTSNIYVYYTSPITQVIAPGQGTVTSTSLSQGGPSWDTSGNVTLTGNVTLNNGAADGAQLTLASAGYSNWNVDNYSGRFRWYYNATEYMTLDTSGNLGLSVVPSAWTSGVKAIDIQSCAFAGSGTQALSLSNAYTNGSNWIYKTSNYASMYEQYLGNHKWYTAASGTAGNAISFTQAMTLDPSGVLCVGSTSNTWAVAGAIKTVGITSHAGQSGAYQNNGINLEWRAGALRIWVDTTDLGTVQFASDYRIKKDIATQTLPALDRIAQLRPVTFEFGDYGDLFKGDNVAREGFIAHEVAEVIPSAVDGEKDCENQIQSLRLDALCSVMVKAIQEQQAIIETLTSRITALENK